QTLTDYIGISALRAALRSSGAAGRRLAVAGTRALVLAAPTDVPRLDEAGVDAVVGGYALALSLLTGLLFGLAPALRTFAGDLHRSEEHTSELQSREKLVCRL